MYTADMKPNQPEEKTSPATYQIKQNSDKLIKVCNCNTALRGLTTGF
jgi:hypothetical protein